MAGTDWDKGSMTPPADSQVDWDSGTITEPGAEKSPGIIRKAADLGLGFAGGAVGATKALTDAAGAGNAASNLLDDAGKGLDGWLSPQAQADKAEQSRIMQDAEGKGLYEGVKAGVKAFGVAPLQTMVSGVGSVVPIVAATAATGGGALPAMAAGAATGVAMGAGTAKGAIYDEIKKRGGTEEDAIKAQEYGGVNTDQIALGGALGVADALTGVTPVVGGMVRKALGKPVIEALAKGSERGIVGRMGMGALGEMPLEAAQGGQEQVAANLAAQRAGYQAGTWDNVASNATLEGLASAGPGAGFGAMAGGPKPVARPAAPPVDAPVDQAPPEQPPPLLEHDPMAGTHTVFPDGSIVLNSESSNGAATVRDMQRNNRLEKAALGGLPPELVEAFDQSRADAKAKAGLWSALPVEEPVKPSEAMGLAPTVGPSITNAAITAVDTGAHQAQIPTSPMDAPLSALGLELSKTNQRLRQEADALGLDTDGLHGDAARMTDGKPHEDYLMAANDQIRKAMKAAKELPDEVSKADPALAEDGAGTKGPDTKAAQPVNNALDGVKIEPSPDNGEWDRLTYKGVKVDFEQNGSTASVFNITSSNKRTGEATEALSILKKKFGNVVTDGVVEDSREAIAFWQSMLDKGIASKAKRTDGIELLVKTQPINTALNVKESTPATSGAKTPEAQATQAPADAGGNDSAAQGLPGAGSGAVQAVVPANIEKPATESVAPDWWNALDLQGRNLLLNHSGIKSTASEWDGLQESEKSTLTKYRKEFEANAADSGKTPALKKADLEHLFGVDQKRAAALARIAAGKGWFGSGPKAQEFIAKNGLKDTHKAVKSSDGKRWDVAAVTANTIDDAAHQAATSPNNDLAQPTDGQKKAGNYAKGHVILGGLDLSIENPAGSERSGTDKDGKAWTNTLQHHYGYIKGTMGNDKDHVDLFVKPETPLDYSGQVFVIDQIHPHNGRFDEHKVMVGFDNEAEAKKAYFANYAKGWKGMKALTPMSFSDFSTWVKAGPKNVPLSQETQPATQGATSEPQADQTQQTEAKRPQEPAAADSVAPGAALRDAMASAGWGAEVAGAGNLIWIKRVNKDRYTAILTPWTNSMEVTVLVDTVDTQIASFKVADPKDAAIAANKAVSDDVSDSVPAAANPKIKAALDKKNGLGAQLAELNAELERQGEVQNANTRAQRDAIRKQIAEQDFPEILKAVDDNIDVAEELNRAFKYAGDEPKAKTIERILKKRGITPEYQNRWSERLLEEGQQAGTKPESVVKVPEAIGAAIQEQMEKQKRRVMRRHTEESAPGLNLEQRLAAQTKTKAAEAALRQMRTSVFDAEDSAIKAIQTGKASEFEKHADLFPAANDAIRSMLGQNDELDSETQAYEAGLTAQTRADDKQKLSQAAKPDALTEREKAAKAKMFGALGKLAALASKNTRMNWTPEEEQQLLPIVIELFDGAMELGAVTFQKAVRYVREFIGSNLDQETADAIPFETLQGAYIHTARKYKDQGATSGKEVMQFESLADIGPAQEQAPAEVSAQVRDGAKAAGAEAAADLFDWAAKESTRAKVQIAVADALFASAPEGTPGLMELAKQITDELALEYTDQKADTDAKDTQNDPGTEKQGGGTLDGVPAAEVGEPGVRGPGGRGTRHGSKSRRKGNSSADGGRGASGRGGRSGAAGTDTASTGEPGGGSGVAGSGGRIPADSGAPDVKLPAGGKRGPRPGTPSLFTENGEVVPAAVPAANFTITPDLKLGSGGETVKYRDNIAAIRTLKLIEAEHRRATPDEQRTLARYVGWGGLANAFRNRVTGAVKADWAGEVAELESLLTAKELKAASASTPNAHYTSETVTGFMWRAAQRLGFSGGMVLEPSVGSGNFLGLMPASARKGSYITGIELDSITARIAAALYPQSNIVESGFEKLPLPENTFDLAIGNPPFGKIDLRFQYNPKLNGKSIHNQFFLGSMDAVKPGGLQVMVVSRYLMDAQESGSREALAMQAELIGAIRLPGSAFKGNAGTDVVTDILFLKKRTEADAKALLFALNERGAKIPAKESYGDRAERQVRAANLRDALDWTGTTSVPDPLGGEPMIISKYFAKNPGMVAGVMDRSGSMQFGGDIDVKLPASELQGRLDALLDMLPSTEPITASEEVDLRTQAMHKALGESLSIMASGREVGSIYYDESGALTEIVERVGLGGKTIVSKNVINASTPWSAQLSMNMEGKWFKEVAQLDEKGEKVKVGIKINPKTLKATKGRNVYVREVFENTADIPAGMRLGEVGFAKLQKLVAIRELYVEQINLETNAATTEKMEANREKLRAAYEAFVADHGYISEQKNASIISEMPDEGLMLSLELKFRPAVNLAAAVKRGIKPRPASAQQNAILTKAVAIPPGRKDSAASVSDAVAIVLGESGRIDVARVAELLGKTEDDALSALTDGDSPISYMDPETNEVTEKNQYLSGNVRKKLLAAQEAGLKRNVAALEKVQPEAWSSDKVTVHMGSSWVPPAIYADFVSSLLGREASVSFSAVTNTFEVSSRGESAVDVSRWGTQRVPAVELLNLILNSRRVAVYDGGGRDEPRVLNETETQSAIDKKKEIIEEFDNWVFKDGDRRQQLVRLFNDLYNTRVNRQYDGAHMVFPGKVPDSIIEFRRSQTNAVWRGIVDDFVMYDHAVGAGKTFTGIARAMERKRMGLSNKPTVVVPNHLVSEWSTQAYRLYPGAKILAAGVKDLEPKNRRRLFAKIAAGNWDIVILPHSSFKFISIAPETEERFIEDELRVAREALADAEADAEPGQRFKPLSVKAAEGLIVKLENRMDTVRGRAGKDMLLTFEQMGIDDLTIDESHEFKNLTYTTKLTDVRGLGPAAGSQKAFDLYTKMRILHETGGSAAFLTGTPISNSAVEMYTIMRYLAPDVLRDSGLEHFDAFRAQFVEASEKPEPTEAGDGLKVVNRLGRNWSNMRSLMDGYYSVADVVTNDDIKKWFAEDNPGKVFPLPNVKGGGRRTVKAIPTPTQESLIAELIAGYNNLPNIEDMKERNATRLRLMDRARKLALHAKVWDKSLTDEPGGKLDMVVDEAIRIYKAFEADKGTQLIFLDRSVPKAQGDDRLIKEYDALRTKMAEAVAEDDERGQREAIEALEKFDPQEIDELRAAQAGGWNAYQHMADGLIAKGVPKEQIAFIQNYNTDAEKKALFEAVNDGAIRFLFGSSARMGAGMNVQERLVGLHHVDVTWKPSDIEQREGRIIRQGNYFFMPDIDGEPNPMYRADFEVEIMAYVTERSIDAKMWDLNSTKLRMVNGIRYYDGEFEMDFDDDAAIDMAEIAAIASGDPLMLERIKVNTVIEELYRKRRSFNRRIESAGDSLRQAERTVETYPGQIIKAKALMVPARKAIEDANLDQSQRSVTIGGEKFRFLQLALASATEAIKILKEGDTKKAFALDIDGESYTSEAGVMDAIAQKLGDVDPFVAEIAGEKVIRRTAVAREMRRVIGDQFTEVPSTPIGSLYGFPLRMATSDGYAGSKYVTLAVDIPYSGGIEHINASWDITPDKHKKGTPVPVLTSSLRVVVDRLAERIDRIGKDTYEISSMERNLEEAKVNIPTYQEAVKEKFKQADELDAAVSRLDDIQGQLQARANAATSGPAAPAAAPAAADDGDADVSFSRAKQAFSQRAQAQATEAVERLANGIAARWENGPKIVVAFDMQDARIPERIRQEDLKQRSGGAVGTPEGFYYKGAVYLMSSKLNTPNDTARVLFHEALGHHGLRNAFGGALKPILQQIVTMRRAQVDAKVKEYGLRGVSNLDRLTAAEEVLAEMAQTTPTIGFVTRAISAIRTWLRTNVPGFKDLALTDDEIIRSYLIPARNWVERGQQSKAAGGLPMFSRADQTMTDKFKRWFAGSKVVDADGKPLVVYHGTTADFTAFDPAKRGSKTGVSDAREGFFFAANGKAASEFTWESGDMTGSVMPVFLSMQNPLRVKIPGEWAPRKYDAAIADAKAGGHDGLIIEGAATLGTPGDYFIAFRPEQIKSAIGNNGDFDPKNPDIRFSRAATARDLTQKATEAVRVFTNTPGKVNWWHKTVGTQYNLAQRSPQFKRVYDAVQDFIGDVSFYATEAADLAPKILPKLDTWRDIAKSPVSGEDTKAIAAPIFEGTLIWARDESGRPMKVKQLEDEAALMSSDRKAQRLLRNDKISEGVLKMWRGLPMEQYEALIDGKYEKEMLKGGLVWSDAELKSQFGLNDGQIGLYKEFRASTDKSLTNLAISDMLYFGGKDVADIREAVLDSTSVGQAAETLRDYLLSMAEIDPGNAETLIATANKMIDKGDRAAGLMARGYAPLSRFGSYTLDVVDADGERVYFGLFESRFESAKMAKQMAAEYPGATVKQGTLSEESYKLFAGVSPETVALFGDMLGLEDNGAYQDYLKLAKSTRSAMKRLIERKGIAGFSEDAGRVLAGFVYSNARQTSQNMHTGEMAQAASEIPKGMGELKDKATQLVEYIKNPVEEAQRIRGLLFAQYIGGSVASAMVNMTQPLTMTMPWLTQFGGLAKASKQMSAGVRDALRKTTGDKALDAALKRGEEDGTVSPQEVHDLMRQAQGKGALKSGDGTKLGNAAATAQNVVSRIGFGWGKLFSTAEQFNRRATFIAAYRTAIEQGMKNPDAFARRAIHETQGVYNKGNKPDWARGALGSTLFTFKQYSVAYVEMLHRMATTGAPGSPERAAGRRGALYALAVLMLLSGLGGMPGADDLDDIISGLMQALGYNFDSKAKRKAFLAEYLGDGAAQFMERGVSGLAGVPIDISGRMGLGNLIPATGLLTKKADHTQDVAELLGPAGDMAKRAFQAGGKLIDGDVLGNHGAIATAAPKAVQNLFQAADMADKGMYRDQTGKKVMETGPGDALAKALGFQPNDVKRQQDATWEVKRMVDLNRITETEIADRWAIGLFEKDMEKVQGARDDLAKWNADNPESPIRIKFPQILQRVRAMNQTKAERIAKTAPRELKAQVREALSQQ